MANASHAAGSQHMGNAEDIIPRDIRFGILENAQRHWLEDDIIKTILIDGLSIFLPEGERFFIRSLKHYGPKLQDKELAAEINGYSVQEAYHTREHEEYNRALMKLGYDVEKMEAPIRQGFEIVKNPLHRLSITCAIEHMTATLSTGFEHFASPAGRTPWPLASTVFHDQHHGHFRFNYGHTFSLWDRWMGTLHPRYDNTLKNFETSEQVSTDTASNERS